MDTIFDILKDLMPLWYFLALVITVLVTRFYYTRFKKTEDAVNTLPCQDESYRFERKETAEMTKENNEMLKGVSNWMERLERILISKDTSFIQDFSETRSPRQLNELGERLLLVSRGKEALSKELPRLIELMTQESLSMDLDVENEAYRLLSNQSEEQWFAPIKDFVYNNPIFEGRAISITTLSMLLGLVLRNAYFEHRDGLKEGE